MLSISAQYLFNQFCSIHLQYQILIITTGKKDAVTLLVYFNLSLFIKRYHKSNRLVVILNYFTFCSTSSNIAFLGPSDTNVLIERVSIVYEEEGNEIYRCQRKRMRWNERGGGAEGSELFRAPLTYSRSTKLH